MDDRGLVTRRDVGGQPLDQGLHGINFFGLAGPILFGPARDLAFKIIAWAAKITQPDGGVIHLVERCDDSIHVIKNGRSFCGGKPWQARVPEDAAIDMFHPVERSANYGLVLAKGYHLRNRNVRIGEALLDPEFTLDGMRRG